MDKPENKPENDLILSELAEKIEPVCEQISKKHDEYGVFCLGVKLIGDDETGAVQTYTNISGFYGVIAEGLYSELAEQIERGELNLFSLLSEVIHDLEEDFSVSPNATDSDNGEEEETGTLH